MLEVDAGLDGTQLQVRDKVAKLVRGRSEPEFGDWFESGEPLMRDIARELGELGLLGMHLEGYGCAGRGSVTCDVACRELKAGESGLRSFVSVQGLLAMFSVHADGSEEQRQEWLPRMAAGESIGCFGLTEADSGFDPAAMRTRARRDGTGDDADGIIDDSKAWSTNRGIADVAVIWERCDDERVRGLVVPTDTPGFVANKVPRKQSLRASITSELVIGDMRRIPSAAMPGVATMCSRLPRLSETWYGIVWGVPGAGASLPRVGAR